MHIPFGAIRDAAESLRARSPDAQQRRWEAMLQRMAAESPRRASGDEGEHTAALDAPAGFPSDALVEVHDKPVDLDELIAKLTGELDRLESRHASAAEPRAVLADDDAGLATLAPRAELAERAVNGRARMGVVLTAAVVLITVALVIWFL